MFGPPPPIPAPVYSDDDDARFEGDMVVFPAPQGRRVTLAFASPYETFLTLDGKRVREHTDTATRSLLVWEGRHLPALYRALEHRYALTGVLEEERADVRSPRLEITVLDVVDLERRAFLEHGQLRRLLAPARVKLPAFAVLGPIATRTELSARLRGLYAAGTAVEVRAEEQGRVVSRRRFQVGRG